jgi:Uma2 family endonuclease
MDNLARVQYDDWRYEVISGKIVDMGSPSPRHMKISGLIYSNFEIYLKGKTCTAFHETDVKMADDTVFRPDVMVICNPNQITDKVNGPPTLVVEVLSPSSGTRDKVIKKNAYEMYGVLEYWIVFPDSKKIEVYLNCDGEFVLDKVYEENDVIKTAICDGEIQIELNEIFNF